MPELTFDHEKATDYCEHCGKEYAVSRGSVYEDNFPIAIYVAGMHGCEGEAIVVLAIALAQPDKQTPVAITLQIMPTETEFEMRIISPDYSPWREYAYLGHTLSRADALASPQKELFFRIADLIVIENPEVNDFLNADF